MPSGLKPVPMQESLAGEQPIPVPNLAHHALAQDLEKLGDVWVAEKSGNDEFERVKEGRDY